MIPPHSHDKDELMVVLAGSATLDSGAVVEPPDTLLLAANVEYGFTAGPEGMEFMVVRNRPSRADHHRMSLPFKDLVPLVRPRSIALVGATPIESNKLGSWTLSNLLKHDVPADLYLVNPRYDSLEGRPCYPDLESLPEPPELVLVLVPAAAAIDVLRQAEALGSRAAIVLQRRVR